MALRCDANGHLLTAASVPSSLNFFLPTLIDGSFNATLVAEGPAVADMVHGFVTLQTPLWLMLYDLARVPSPATDEPVAGYYLAAQQPFDKILNAGFSSGLGFAFMADPTVPPEPVTAGFSAVTGFNLSYSA